jgi:Peptidase S24-like
MDSWSRLHKVILWSGMTTNAFALSIGLKRSENLYQIKKGNNDISRDLADQITIIYCNISKSWLLTGEGSMFINETEEVQKEELPLNGIPFYGSIPLASILLNENEEKSKPLHYIIVPELESCDLAITCVGNSMLPDISSGSILTLKEIDLKSLLSGEVYCIVTNNFSTVRIVRTLEDDTKVRLIPKNIKDFDETVLNKQDILRIFLVKGVITLRIL